MWLRQKVSCWSPSCYNQGASRICLVQQKPSTDGRGKELFKQLTWQGQKFAQKDITQFCTCILFKGSGRVVVVKVVSLSSLDPTVVHASYKQLSPADNASHTRTQTTHTHTRVHTQTSFLNEQCKNRARCRQNF